MLTTHSQLGQLNTAILISCSGCEYPNVATISRLVVLQTRLVTCEKTLISAKVAPDPVWKKWIWRSLLPPPVANRFGCQGANAIALTAAKW
jgi:hypothetical protein